jgi:hypothetical protein
MINGVLVERTVKDVVPALKTNSEGLKEVLETLLKQYKTKQDEMDKWKVSLTRIPKIGPVRRTRAARNRTIDRLPIHEPELTAVVQPQKKNNIQVVSQ